MSWQTFNQGVVLAPTTLITLAGKQLQQRDVSEWWEDNRDELVKLSTWDAFAARFREEFVASTWRMDALVEVFAVVQGSSTFDDFVRRFNRANGLLTSAGTKWAFNDTMIKYHLLMHAHPLLRLHTTMSPGFDIHSLRPRKLISLMSSHWDCLVANGTVKLVLPARVPAAVPPPPSHALPTALSAVAPTTAVTPTTQAERDALRARGGCYHCRLGPGDAGWTTHRKSDCPGNPTLGIPPRSATKGVNAVVPRSQPDSDSSEDEARYFAPGHPAPGLRGVHAVVPHIEDDESSFDTGDSSLEYR